MFMQNKKIILSVIVVVALLGLIGFWKIQGPQIEKSNKDKSAEKVVLEKKNDSSASDEIAKKSESSSADLESGKIIYYYGTECPHCQEVLKYMDENDIYNKVDFIKKEVWHNKNNGKELNEAAQKCGLDPSDIGVPFVYANGKCLMGGPDVEGFFAEKAGIKK